MSFYKNSKFESFRKFIKSKYSIKIQRKKCFQCYGWYRQGLIVIDKEADDDLAIFICLHELAHFLAENKEKDHDLSWAKAYCKAYQDYIEWTMIREKE